MKKIAIIKTGATFQDIAGLHGDFDDWTINGMGVNPAEVLVFEVYKSATLPEYQSISGIVITGSHTMLTDHLDWSELTARWLAGAVEKRIPTLGVCYGHQLLAYALGGKVGYNPNGKEYGTVQVTLNETAAGDPLFKSFQTPLLLNASHSQSVLQLPQGARLLASSSFDNHHAFIINENAWGVQFHPEFNLAVMKAYIEHNRPDLPEADKLLSESVETPAGPALLRRFYQIIKENHDE